MKKLLLILLIISNNMVQAQSISFPPAKVNFDDFKSLVAEVEPHRKERLINLDTFLQMSQEKGIIILDTRSTYRYDRKHIKGALHLDFTDFTQDNLARIIPSFDTKILIYCNNNFDGDEIDFATKMVAFPKSNNKGAINVERQFALKPMTLALNIPTYINLYGYGYHNVYELSELVNVNDRRVTFAGSVVKKK